MQRRRPACFVVFGNGQCPDAQSAKLASLKRSGRPGAVHQSPSHSPSLAGGSVIMLPCGAWIGPLVDFVALPDVSILASSAATVSARQARVARSRSVMPVSCGSARTFLACAAASPGAAAQCNSVPANSGCALLNVKTAIASPRMANGLEPIGPQNPNSQPDRHHAQAGGREFKTAHARKTARRFLAAEAWTYNAASRPKGRAGDMISGSCQPLALRGFEAPEPTINRP